MKSERLCWNFAALIIPMLTWLFLTGQSKIPSPKALADTLLENKEHHIVNLVFSGSNAAFGIGIATVLTFLIVIAVAFRPTISSFFYPYIIFLKATPAIAFAPFYIMLVGAGHSSRALVAASICFFPLVVGALSGLARVPERLVLMPEIYGATSWRRFWSIDWGYAFSGFVSGLLTAAPLSVVGSIVGDYVIGGHRPEGIGGYLLPTIANPQPLMTMSGIVLCTTLGLIFFGLAKVTEKITNDWLQIEKL